MRYLITGHTGFKGSWLSVILRMQGHIVSGIALDPPVNSIFHRADLSSLFKHDYRIDIRDERKISKAIIDVDPEVIIHLAAQPLVRESYLDPVGTFTTNVVGTLNVLESAKNLVELKASLIVTTDKVYKNFGRLKGYTETDQLGGDDPYSASKAAADLATQSWVKSFAKSPVSIARAGNVIGGGDWATDRIIPDLVEAFSLGKKPIIRYPNSIRPWQHVLDCLNGYQMLVDHMLINKQGGEWNFGPQFDEKYTVSELVIEFGKAWGLDSVNFEVAEGEQPPESNLLLLDSTKSKAMLGWEDKLNFKECLKFTADWYKNFEHQGILLLMERQIKDFQERGFVKL
jgi:CDP-glucose 4,6-dehydratase